jgi:hypothetical protein
VDMVYEMRRLPGGGRGRRRRIALGAKGFVAGAPRMFLRVMESAADWNAFYAWLNETEEAALAAILL